MPVDLPPTAATGRSSGGWLRVLFILLLGLALGSGGGYFYAQRSVAPAGGAVLTSQELAAQDEALRQAAVQLRFVRGQLDTADGELVIERSARQELETQLRAVQTELGRVRDRLAFYEQLLPPGPEGSVDIRGVEIDRDGSGLRYRVLLMRSGRIGTPFVGTLRFQATGTLKGETTKINLLPLQVKSDSATLPIIGDAATASPLALQFDQYQRSQGVLAIPEGFVPENITVSVLEGETIRASRSVKLEF